MGVETTSRKQTHSFLALTNWVPCDCTSGGRKRQEDCRGGGSPSLLGVASSQGEAASSLSLFATVLRQNAQCCKTSQHDPPDGSTHTSRLKEVVKANKRTLIDL